MSKLYRARSLLYRRQILQENIRWKALDEIYKIYMLLHRSDLNISENVRQTFSHSLFFGKFYVKFACFIDSCSDVDDLCRSFADVLENVGILNIPTFSNFLAKLPEFWYEVGRTTS